jgi:hypothetical protein
VTSPETSLGGSGRVTSPETSRGGSGPGNGTVSPWRGTAPELAVAGALVAAAALAGYAVAGWAGLSAVAAAAAAVAMVVLRGLLPELTPDAANTAASKPAARPLTGYSRRRHAVRTAMTSQGFYDSELRPVLEHLLAARLAERHGVHLYHDPDAARRLLCRTPRDGDLWPWVDPAARPQAVPGTGAAAPGGPDRRGIPPRTLARLIDRLEKL